MNAQLTSKNIFVNVRNFVPRNNKNIMGKPAIKLPRNNKNIMGKTAIKLDGAGYENVTNQKSVRDLACRNNMHICVRNDV